MKIKQGHLYSSPTSSQQRSALNFQDLPSPGSPFIPLWASKNSCKFFPSLPSLKTQVSRFYVPAVTGYDNFTENPGTQRGSRMTDLPESTSTCHALLIITSTLSLPSVLHFLHSLYFFNPGAYGFCPEVPERSSSLRKNTYLSSPDIRGQIFWSFNLWRPGRQQTREVLFTTFPPTVLSPCRNHGIRAPD